MGRRSRRTRNEERHYINDGRSLVVTTSVDNRQGLAMLNRLLALTTLSEKEREFCSSLHSQIDKHPMKFRISEKQWWWLRDIWHRKIKVEEFDVSYLVREWQSTNPAWGMMRGNVNREAMVALLVHAHKTIKAKAQLSREEFDAKFDDIRARLIELLGEDEFKMYSHDTQRYFAKLNAEWRELRQRTAKVDLIENSFGQDVVKEAAE
jgi:hypothetical protein